MTHKIQVSKTTGKLVAWIGWLAVMVFFAVPVKAQDLTGSVVDLGSWASLNPYGTTDKTALVLANHQGRIYIGHGNDANSKANAAVFYDSNTGAFGNDKQPDGTTVVLIDNEEINYGLVRQGDLVWSGVDGAVAHNGAWLYVKRHDGWKAYKPQGANAHTQDQYIYGGKIFLSNFFRSKPGVAISYDGGSTTVEKDQRSATVGSDFPNLAEGGETIDGWLSHSFFEFRGHLFALNWTLQVPIVPTPPLGTPFPPQEAWMTHYTGNVNQPWEKTWRRMSDLGFTGLTLSSNSVYDIPKPIEAVGYLWMRVGSSLYRYGFQTVTGSAGTYDRPASGTRVSTTNKSLVSRNGYLYRADRSGDIVTLLRTSDGTVWTTLCTLNVSASSSLSYLQSTAYPLLIEVAGQDIYLAQRSRLFKIPGTALGANKPSGSANTAPVATNDTFTANYGLCTITNAFQGPLLNDKDGNDDAFYATLVSPPSQGTLTFRYNGTFEYSANGSFSGTDSFTYKVSDGYAESTATVTLSGTAFAANPGFNAAKINFQAASGTPPTGYFVDSGGLVGLRNNLVYGWNETQTGTNRGGNANFLLDTFVAMKAGAKWQVSVPNGTYEVKASLGDATVACSGMQLNVEGANFFQNASTAINQFVNATNMVTVSDNWLTVDAGSSSTTKLNYLEINKVDAFVIQDIGAPALTGNTVYDDTTDTFTLQGGGDDIWGSSDQFHFAYKEVNGDCTLVARVATVQNTNAWAKAGLMMRDGTAANAIHADIFITPGNGVTFQRRTSTGGATVNSAVAGVTAPRWLKLVRTGSTISGFYGSDGVTWIQVGSTQTVTMPGAIKAGMAVTSHNAGSLAAATFTNVAIPYISLLNAGFEAPAVTTFQYNPAGAGWTFTGNSGVQRNGSAWGGASAPEGVQTAFLQHGSVGGGGTISQTISLPAGTYALSFKAARRNTQVQPIQVKVNGVAVGSPITPTSSTFALFTSANFTVTGGNHSISLETTATGGDLTSFVDAIMLIPQ